MIEALDIAWSRTAPRYAHCASHPLLDPAINRAIRPLWHMAAVDRVTVPPFDKALAMAFELLAEGKSFEEANAGCSDWITDLLRGRTGHQRLRYLKSFNCLLISLADALTWLPASTRHGMTGRGLIVVKGNTGSA